MNVYYLKMMCKKAYQVVLTEHVFRKTSVAHSCLLPNFCHLQLANHMKIMGMPGKAGFLVTVLFLCGSFDSSS